MGYVNFKEERFKAKNQLKKRRENNKKLFDELIKTRELPKYISQIKSIAIEFLIKSILVEEEF